jgi:hypothetical protein
MRVTQGEGGQRERAERRPCPRFSDPPCNEQAFTEFLDQLTLGEKLIHRDSARGGQHPLADVVMSPRTQATSVLGLFPYFFLIDS